MDSTGTVKPDLTPEMIMCDPEKLENQPDSSKSLLAEYKRPFNNVKWGFICAGLFVGAILFGNFSFCVGRELYGFMPSY